MGEIGNIDATCRYVGGNNNADGSLTHFVEDQFSLFLGKISMQRLGIVPTVYQLSADFITLDLGSAENNAVETLFHVDDAGKSLQLVGLLHLNIDLVGEVAGHGVLLDLDQMRITHEPFGKPLYRLGHGRGETEHALFSGCLFQYFFDIIDETHIEHFVCFVEYHELEMLEVQGTASEVVEDTTGSSNNDMHAPLEFTQLQFHGGTAVYSGNFQPSVSLQGVDLFSGLYSKFTSGCENECLDLIQ